MFRLFTLVLFFALPIAQVFCQSTLANPAWLFNNLSGTAPEGVPVDEATLAAGLTASHITRGSGVVAATSNGEFVAKNWTATSAAAARDAGQLFTVTLTPAPDQALTIGTIQIVARRSGGNNALTGYALYLNGQKLGDTGTFTGNANTDNNLDRTANATFAEGEAVTIEVVGWGAGSSNADFSLRSFSLASSSLPVTLKSFSVVGASSTTDLTWVTTTETDNDYFAIERSADGRSFEPIGRIDGIGTTAVETKYSYTDLRPLPGRSYYRLRQVDYDGTTEYFGPVAVTRTSSDRLSLRIFPNPTADRATLETELAANSQIVLLDAAGRVLRSWRLAHAEVRYEISLIDLAPGVYYLRTEAAGTRAQTVRVLKS